MKYCYIIINGAVSFLSGGLETFERKCRAAITEGYQARSFHYGSHCVSQFHQGGDVEFAIAVSAEPLDCEL